MDNNSSNVLISDNLVIHNINVNSLIAKYRRHNLEQHLIDNKPDIVFVTETCLNKRHNLNFRNYNFIRSDKVEGKRGTGILILNKYSYKVIGDLNIDDFESTAILLNDINGGKILIVSVYAHKNSNFDDLNKIFGSTLDYDYVICGGDFNARHVTWLDYLSNLNGNRLLAWFQLNENLLDVILLHSRLPTRIVDGSFSYIDKYIITNNLGNHLSSNLLEVIDYESDHSAVVLRVKIPQLIRRDPTFVLNFNKVNWVELNKQVSASLLDVYPPNNKNLTNDDIDTAVDLLNNIVNQAVSDNVPRVKVNQSNLLILEESVLKLIKTKKRMRRIWFENGRNNGTMKSLIARLTKIIKDRINIQYAANLDNLLLSIKPGPKLFQEIKKISSYGKRTSYTLIDNCIDNQESAEKLADHFETIHNSTNLLHSNHDEVVNNYIGQLSSERIGPIIEFSDQFKSDKTSSISNELFNEFSSVANIQSIIKSRRNIKSAGVNKISNFIIRKLPIEFSGFLTILINNAFNNSYFPKIWKLANVIPVPKTSGISSSVRNFRPIALLCSISKIYECFIKDKFDGYCLSTNSINRFQFGFTRGRSTSQAITLFQENVFDGFQKKEPCLAVSLDLMKAFDKVWIDGLIFKLKSSGMSDNFCHLMYSYLKGRTFTVKFNDKNSVIHDIKAGVPQGSIMGPSLFNFFIYDFPIDWANGIGNIFFADDILLYKSCRNVSRLIDNMNNYLNSVVEFLKIWKLSLNVDKCEMVLFRKQEGYIPKNQKKYKDNGNVRVILNNQELVAKDSFKYLGVIFQKKCSVIPHLDRTLKKAASAFAMLRGVFMKKLITTRTKEICYKQLIKPILLYGYSGWCHISSHQMVRIRRFERKVLYKCLPASEAYTVDIVDNSYRLIHKVDLYKKFKNFVRIDNYLFRAFIRHIQKLEFIDIDRLNCICDTEFLNDRYIHSNDKYRYKCFSPSFLYKLYLDDKTSNENNIFTFCNRRFNSNNLDVYVYDLAEPD